MPVATAEQFWDLLSAARLVSADEITALRRDDSTATPEQIAQRLVQTGRVTRWQANMLLAGRTRFFLGKYKLLDKLGEGGMGTVFKAEQSPLGRIVAVKLMAEALVSSESSVARFRREIQAAAALNHPNIVLAYDADCVGNTHFLVMEYVQGEDLASLARRRGALPVGEACGYVLQAAHGLAHASQRGLIHRDIKPANLILSTARSSERGTGSEEPHRSALLVPRSSKLSISDWPNSKTIPRPRAT